MINDLFFNNILDIFNILIIPLFIWIWKTDRKTLILESELKNVVAYQKKLEEYLSIVVTKLDEIKDEIHASFVHSRDCDFRHR